MLDSELRKSCVNTIRFLAADAVEKAKSGHPGAPMGMADMSFVLWNQFLRYDPDDPDWKIVIVLSSRQVMLRCCFIPCFTWLVTS